MKIRPARHGDLPAIGALLSASGLPADDIGAHLATLLVGEQHRAIVAAGALEPLGTAALLRSLVVASLYRGRGWGSRMARHLIAMAHSLGIRDLYLLTEMSPEFFAALDFVSRPREDAPQAVRATRQFSALCPATAILMHRHMGGDGTLQAGVWRRP
jgi:N-acetylglutamate synthase-like GNAT family acetyltransferase